MKEQLFGTKLVVLAAALAAGCILVMGTAWGASPTFLSPVSTPSPRISNLYLPFMARNYQAPPPDFLRAPLWYVEPELRLRP